MFEGSALFIVERAVIVPAASAATSPPARRTRALGTPSSLHASRHRRRLPPVCDDRGRRLQGSSVGRVFGGGFDGFGYVIGDDRAGIEYAADDHQGYLEQSDRHAG